MTFLAWRKCEVCGFEANEPTVQPSVGKLPDRTDGLGKIIEWGPVLDVIRCRRVDECRARADAAGRPWPFQESRWQR
jgi:hypothetical protein